MFLIAGGYDERGGGGTGLDTTRGSMANLLCERFISRSRFSRNRCVHNSRIQFGPAESLCCVPCGQKTHVNKEHLCYIVPFLGESDFYLTRDMILFLQLI